MLEFSFVEKYSPNGKKFIVLSIPDKTKSVLGTFFVSDLNSLYPKYYIEAIDSVLSGKQEKASIRGNVCELIIEKENTKVYDTLDDENSSDECVIGTRELRELIIIWHKKYMEINKENEERKNISSSTK